MMNIRTKNFIYLLEIIISSCISFILYSNQLKILAILILPVILALLYIYLKDKIVLILFCMILIGEQVLGLVPSIIASSFETEKLNFVLLIFLYIYWFEENHKWKNSKDLINKKNFPKFNYIAYFVIVLICISVIVAKVNINQSIILGFAIQAEVFILLAVFPLIALLPRENHVYIRIRKGIMCIAVVGSLLYIIQFYLYNYIVFLKFDSPPVRNGTIRLTSISNLVIYGLFISIHYTIRKRKIKYFITSIIMFYYLLIVSQTRMVIFGVLISIIFIFITDKEVNKLKLVIMFYPIAFIGIIIMQPIIGDLVSLTVQELGSTKGGNYNMRLYEMDYYTKQVSNPLFGRGYITPKSPAGQALDSFFDGSGSIKDIGIIGLYVTNGYIGVIWYLLMLLIMLKKSLELRRKGIVVSEAFGYVLFQIATIPTLLTLYYSPIYAVITMILINEYDICSQIINEDSIKENHELISIHYIS